MQLKDNLAWPGDNLRLVSMRGVLAGIDSYYIAQIELH